MSKIEVLESKPITLAELKDSIQKIQERDEELNFRSGKTQEFVNHFSTMPLEKANELKQKLVDLNIPRIKEDHIVKIIDFLPVSIEDLEVLLQGYPITVTKESQEKIVSLVKEYK